jgi:hypothetical protein
VQQVCFEYSKKRMKLRNNRTYILIIVIITVIVGISFVIPYVYFSESYNGVLIDENWTPVATDTPIPTSVTLTPEKRAIITVSLTPTSEKNTNCTYPLEYWLGHTELWIEMLVGNVLYSESDIRAIIDSKSQDEQQILLKELYITNLNIISGADPEEIEDTIVEANKWFRRSSPEEQITEEAYFARTQLIQTLIDFNNGFIGPGLCPPYESPTRTVVESVPTVTVSPLILTPTSTATRFSVTLPPTDTTTPTKTPKRKIDPTNTLRPTSKPATKTPVPQPTLEPTSAPPEDTPKPTNPPEPTNPSQPPTPTPAP